MRALHAMFHLVTAGTELLTIMQAVVVGKGGLMAAPSMGARWLAANVGPMTICW